jgi:hypothetical protein
LDGSLLGESGGDIASMEKTMNKYSLTIEEVKDSSIKSKLIDLKQMFEDELKKM